MCGIVGYIGLRDTKEVILNGLQRLEYRGYDSAGMAWAKPDGTLGIKKVKGKVSSLREALAGIRIQNCTGIGHTRWATHGVPSEKNAHPHISQSGRFALVHNGIIENYEHLREKLIARGYSFKSETDTEVLVQLIDYIAQQYGVGFTEAVSLALRVVVGAYAIAVIDREHPDEIVCARMSSPLVIGLGEKGEYFLASDATPIVEYTDKMVYLKDGEVACINVSGGLQVVRLQGGTVSPEVQRVTLDISKLEKGGFPHFMLKEIYDQPSCLTDCMRGRVNSETLDITLSALRDYGDRLMDADRIVIVACGTSWHAGLIGKRLIEEFCGIPVEVAYASEFRYSPSPISHRTVVIAISQSGETADTLAAVNMAHEKGAFVYGISNMVGSSIPRNTDTGSYIHVGPEIGVASTKAFTGQVTVLAMLALQLGRRKGTLPEERYRRVVSAFLTIPDRMREILKVDDKIRELSRTFTFAHNFIYMGRGYEFPTALEGALKLKEISYIHAEGYPAAEMKHGPIALIDKEMPVVVLATKTDLYDKVVSNIQEIRARGGRILAIVTEGDTEVRQMAETCIEIPPIEPCLEPLLSVIPLQLLAYHVAVYKGLNVDQPRNLAKSVTVE